MEHRKFGYIVTPKKYNEHYEREDREFGSWSATSTWDAPRTAKKVTEYPDVASIHDIPSGSNALIVWVQWGSGDSFGHETGAHAEVIGLFKDFDSAVALRTQIENWSSVRDQSGGYKFKTPDGQVFESGWAPWAGYFECLENVFIDTVAVF